jgi:hypothetical protein
MRDIDGKFATDGSRIYNKISGASIPEDEPLFLLRARDLHAVWALWGYVRACHEGGAPPDHVRAVEHVIARFQAFRRNSSAKMKQPGISGDFQRVPQKEGDQE